MRSVTVRLEDLKNVVINIGFVGENEHTRLTVICSKMYAQYPHAAASMTVQPPAGAAYPAVIERDGDNVIWDVTDSDLAAEGSGEIQLSFTTGKTVAKTYVGRTKVMRSIIPTGEITDPLDDFLTRAGAALTAIPETIDEAFETVTAEAETLESGPATASFDAETKKLTIGVPKGDKGDPGDPGEPGEPGHSPVITASKSGTVTTIYSDGTQLAQINDGQDGEPGQDGDPGADGISPTVTITAITGGHRITIVDADGTHTADVMDGDPTTLIDDTAGAGDTGKVWSANKSSDLLSAINGKYSKPADGIPASDLASGVIPSVPVTDVQVNGTSVLSQGVANIPLAGASPGVASIDSAKGIGTTSGTLFISKATTANIKAGTEAFKPITPYAQDKSVFYGFAKAAGDTSQSSSSNDVGTYTEDAQSKISDMLNKPVTVSGSTPSITAKSGVRYVCGECSTLSITAPASGCVDVVFKSGSTPTVLTVATAKSGATLKWANGFDPTSMEANTVYEINIMDGEYGVACSWT